MRLLGLFNSTTEEDIEAKERALAEMEAEKRIAVEQLRTRVGQRLPSYMNSDEQLSKWLIARNYNLDKAEDMLLKHLKWREEWDLENILSWQPQEVLTNYYSAGFSGFDKGGSPVWIICYGKCDVKGILQCCNPSDYIRYTLQILAKSMEEMKFKTREAGKPVTNQTCIFDLEDFSLRHITYKPGLDIILQLVQIYEANYPENLKHAFVINAPKVFTILMTMIKPFLNEVTLNKIKIFGQSGWKEALLEVIPKDQLPIHWGGSMKDPDGNPKCPSKICLGGEVPKRYYLKKQKRSNGVDICDGSFNSILLPHGRKKCIEVEVLNSGSELRWKFHSEDFDIGFGISRLLPGGDEEIVVPLNRVNSQYDIQEGFIICEHSGTYQITFDNGYSYLRSKKIFYKVEQISPSEQTKL